MQLLMRVLTLSVLIFAIGSASTPARAWISCGGCRFSGGYTVSGGQSVSGGDTVSGGYSVSGGASSSSYAPVQTKADYCNHNYDPRYCYQWYAENYRGADPYDTDYWVVGGSFYK